MRTKTSILLATVVALAVAAPAAAGRDKGDSPQNAKDQTKTDLIVMSCPDDDDTDDVITASADLVMWPPNHKYQDFGVSAIGDSDDDVTLMTSVTHDEYIDGFVPNDDSSGEEQSQNEEVGSGNTVDDARPFMASDSGTASASTMHEIRSERSGRGDGRTYTVSFRATFSDGGEDCSGSFDIEVPHDMRSSNAPAKQDKTGETGPDNG